MLSQNDVADWIEIQDGLARAAEREWEAARLWEFYEKRRLEIAEQIGGRHEGRWPLAMAKRRVADLGA